MKKRINAQLSFLDVVWKIFKFILYLFMVICALSFILSFVWVLINSFKSAPGYMMDCFGLPKVFDFENYAQVLNNLEYKGYGVFGMIGNSMILVLWNVFVCLTIPHMAAYVLARFDFKGRKFLESAIYLSMVIPVIGSSSATMWFLNSVGLFDNFLGVFILQSAGLGFGQVMLTSSIKEFQKLMQKRHI